MKTEDAVKVSISNDYQTMEELLESIKRLSTHIIEDNKLSSENGSEFPTHIRINQASSLESLTKALSGTIYAVMQREEATKNAL